MSFKIIILTLLLCHISLVIPAQDDHVFFHKPILEQSDALQFTMDPNSTIARVVVVQAWDTDNSNLYVIPTSYSITQLLKDVPNKKLNVVVKQEPRKGWSSFYNQVKGSEERIYIQIPVAYGPGDVAEDWELVYNFTVPPPNSFQVVIMAFAEVEDDHDKYREQQILDMVKAFKRKIPVKHQWLRLNAQLLKNMKVNLVRTDFEYRNDRIIIYQNETRSGVSRPEVVEKLHGFDPGKIIWENVQTTADLTTTPISSSKIPSGAGCRVQIIRYVKWLYLLFIISRLN